MKNIFTLLLCALGMGMTASAANATLVDRCIDALLSNPTTTTIKAAADLDADHNGILTIADVTTLIDRQLLPAQAPAQAIDVEAIARQVRETDNGTPTIDDVNKAIEHNLTQSR